MRLLNLRIDLSRLPHVLDFAAAMRHVLVDHGFKLYLWEQLPTKGKARPLDPALVAAGVPAGACCYRLQFAR